MNWEIWTLPNSGSFVRKQDISRWVLEGSTLDLRMVDLSSGSLVVDRACPFLDDILSVDRANHANDVGSTIMLFDEGTWVAAAVPVERQIPADPQEPVEFALEGLEWFMDRARIEPYDHPADPIREGDWIYGAPTILLPAGGEVSDAQWTLYVDGATSGTYTITDGTDTTSNIDYNESDPATIKTRLETDITAITEVVVSGAGTSANEFFIRLTDPAETDLDLSVNDSTDNTGVVLSKNRAGGSPSPRPWHGSIDGNTGDVIGTYETFAMVAVGGDNPTAPTGSSSTHLLKINADTPAGQADYAGAQVEARVIPGHRYRGKINVYSDTAQRIRFIIRTITENEIESDDQNVSADAWTELSVNFTVPDGVETIVYRVGIVEDDNADPVWLDVNGAILAPGVDEATFGEICNDLLAPMQSRSVLDWWTETFSDSQDSTSENWDRDMHVRVRRGQSFMQWLEYGVRWGYERSLTWDGSNWDFGLFNPGNLGTDYTGQGGPTVSVLDGGLGGSPVVQRAPDFTTAIAEGDAGTWGEHTDATLASGWGRLEGYFANRQNTGTDLDSLASQMVSDTSSESDSVRVTLQGSSVRPLVHVKLGDTVPVVAYDGTGLSPSMRRLVAVTYTETGDEPVWDLHFGSLVFDADAAQADALRTLIRRYQALDELGTGTGTIEPLAISSPVPSSAFEATAGTIADGSRKYEHNGTDTTGHDWLIPSGVSAGDMIWAAIQVFGSSQSITSKPAGYTALVDYTNTNVDDSQDYVFYKVADGTETDSTFEISSGNKISAVFWRTESNGVTFGTPEVTSVVEDVDPSPITPTVAGDYAVYTVSHVNKGQPSAPSANYEQVGFAYAENAARRPKTYVQQRAVAITTSEDPGLIDWADTANFRAYRSWTIGLRLDVGTAAVAAGDHTHNVNDADDVGTGATTKGDLLVHDGTDYERLAVGSDGQFLKADSGETLGVVWASGGAVTDINDLGDVTISTPADNEVLAYDNSSGDWINQTAAEAGLATTSHASTHSDGGADEIDAADLASGAATDGHVLTADGSGGAAWEAVPGGGSVALDDLTDVTITTPSNGEVLKYNGSAWVNDTDATGGGGAVPTYLQYLAERITGETAHDDDLFFSDAPGLTGTVVTGDGSATSSWAQERGMLSLTISGSGGSGAREPIARAWAITSASAPMTIETHFTIHAPDVTVDTHVPAVMLGFSDGTTAGSTQVNTYSYLAMAGVLESHGTFNNNGFSGFDDTILRSRLEVYQRVVWVSSNTFQMQIALYGPAGGWSASSMGTLSKTMTPTHYWVGAANTSSVPITISWDYIRVYDSDLSV